MFHHPAITALQQLITTHHWESKFQEAIESARSKNIAQLKTIVDLPAYLDFLNDLLYWVPSENAPGSKVYDRLGEIHYILGLSPLKELQNAVLPSVPAAPLTPLSAWLVSFAAALGAFHDSPESLTAASMQSFVDSPNYNMGDYMEPHGGWKTFNQFFARNYKPGKRPIAALCDPCIIVSAADSTFAGQWEIRTDSSITVKNLHWQVAELMADSPYRGRFMNGLFMHAFLNTTDYHRQHTPVGGTVVEARVITGQVYLEVQAVPVQAEADPTPGHALAVARRLDSRDGAGYQFAQTRGLIVLDTAIGLVAILPIGMSQVSSVIVTAEVGATLRKGEEISYFQFGGSDIVILFESASNVSISAQVGVHYKHGTLIAQAFPVM